MAGPSLFVLSRPSSPLPPTGLTFIRRSDQKPWRPDPLPTSPPPPTKVFRHFTRHTSTYILLWTYSAESWLRYIVHLTCHPGLQCPPSIYSISREGELICHIGPCISRPQFPSISSIFACFLHYQVSTTLHEGGGLQEGKRKKRPSRNWS